EALQQHRPAANRRHERPGHGQVVAGEVELGLPARGEDHLARAGDAHLPPGDAEHLDLTRARPGAHAATVPPPRPRGQGTAARIAPLTSPNPIRPPPAPGAVAEMDTSSPSCRNVRTSPLTVIGSRPPQVSSMNAPRWWRCGPEIVPEANRSPVRADAPFTVMWASICAGDQYISRYGGRETSSPFHSTTSSMSSPQSSLPRR